MTATHLWVDKLREGDASDDDDDAVRITGMRVQLWRGSEKPGSRGRRAGGISGRLFLVVTLTPPPGHTPLNVQENTQAHPTVIQMSSLACILCGVCVCVCLGLHLASVLTSVCGTSHSNESAGVDPSTCKAVSRACTRGPGC